MNTLKELLALREDDKNIVELTTFKGDSIPHEAWTDGVMYKGLNVFKNVYEGTNARTLAKAAEGISDDQEQDGYSLDMQESYLGYSPSKDAFIQGFDGWLTYEAEDTEEDEDDQEDTEDRDHNTNCSPYIVFRLDKDGVSIEETDHDITPNGRMWYGKNGGHEQVKRLYSDIIDIRLD